MGSVADSVVRVAPCRVLTAREAEKAAQNAKNASVTESGPVAVRRGHTPNVHGKSWIDSLAFDLLHILTSFSPGTALPCWRERP